MMKGCILFLFLLLSGQKSVADKTLKTTFNNGFDDWNVQNQSWVTEKWEEVEKEYNGTLPQPSNAVRCIPFSTFGLSAVCHHVNFVFICQLFVYI